MNTKNQTLMIKSSMLAEWMQAGHVCLYDVREDHESSVSRIPGAILLPLSRFDANQVVLPSEKKLVFHCKSGVRCGQAADIMRQFGFQNSIYRLSGGILAWEKDGWAIEKDGY